MALTLAPADVEKAGKIIAAAYDRARLQAGQHDPIRAAMAFRAMVDESPELADAIAIQTAAVFLPEVRSGARKWLGRRR